MVGAFGRFFIFVGGESMFEVVQNIIGQIPSDLDPEMASAVYDVIRVSIPLLAVVFIDLIRDIFSGCFRG